MAKLKLKRFKLIGEPDTSFSYPSTIWEAKKGAIVFCSSGSIQNPVGIINKSKASVILVDKEVNLKALKISKKTIVAVDNPQLIFARMLKTCFPPEAKKGGIHPSSIVHKEANIHPSVYIGPNCIIGKCRVKANAIIHSNVIINDGVSIGRSVIIYPYCVIGYEGFGHIKNEKGVLENFPHVGGVVIEDEVEIFSFSNIDRGSLGDTKIGKGTKIDHYCHIGHNTLVGRGCMITAGTVIAGSVKIGNNVWISPNCSIRDHLEVGDNAFICMGTVVVKNVPALRAGLASRALQVWDQKYKNSS